MKLLCSFLKVETHWFEIYYKYYCEKLKIVLLIYDLYLLIIITNDIFRLIKI